MKEKGWEGGSKKNKKIFGDDIVQHSEWTSFSKIRDFNQWAFSNSSKNDILFLRKKKNISITLSAQNLSINSLISLDRYFYCTI